MINEHVEIPFNRPFLTGAEMEYIAEAVAAQKLSGPGAFSQRAEALIREVTGGVRAVLVPSCSAALEMAALLLNLAPGDEVIVPSYTFVTTANSVVHRGAVPVFVDVDPVTFNIDPDAVAAAVTLRTKAIFVVHYAGVPAAMDRLLAIAEAHGLAVIEDAAQAYGSAFEGRPAGSLGLASCFSFHATKNVVAGEAGALVINRPDLVERALIIRDKGTDRSSYLAGKVDLYTWQDIGSSQVVNEMTAAFLTAQLERVAMIQAPRMAAWARYRDALAPLAAAGHFAISSPPDNVTHNGHIFFVVPHDKAARVDLETHLSTLNIRTVTHYVPLHSSPGGMRFGRSHGAMTQTDRAGDCLLRLPLYSDLAAADQARVIEAIQDWAAKRKTRAA